jgi:hypothetical protein
VSEPMLTIHNRHAAACGIPPAVSTEAADLYMGYFENRYGEQWIFTFDRATREARLRGGDATLPDPTPETAMLAHRSRPSVQSGRAWPRFAASPDP